MSEQASTDASQTVVDTVVTDTTTQADTQVEQSFTEQTTEVPAYTPNFKYKVHDKELEFDEFLRPAIKDPETEKKARELYEKAMGLDEVKTSRDTFKTKYEDVNSKYGNIEKSLQSLSGFVQKNDFDRFFGSLQIPEEKVVQWVINKLKYKELPPEQREQIDRQRSLEMEQEQFMSQQQMHEEQMRDFGMKQVSFELSKPEISQVAKDFDTRAGRQGAFQQEVINRGALYEQVHGVTVPASQLVQELLTIYNYPAQQGTVAQNPAQSQSGQQQVQQVQQQKPSIPVFQSSSNASPVKTQVKSIADLRKLQQERSQNS